MGVSPEEIKRFGIDFNDLPSLLNGQLAYALSGIDEDSDSPTFVLPLAQVLQLPKSTHAFFRRTPASEENSETTTRTR